MTTKLETQLQAARERVAKLEAQLEAEKNKPTIQVGDIVAGEYGRKHKVLVEGPVIAIEGNQALVQGNGLNVHKFFLKDLNVTEKSGGEAVPSDDIPVHNSVPSPTDAEINASMTAEERLRQSFQSSLSDNDPLRAV